MKKAGILNRHLAGALAELGHTDGVLVCDAGMPIGSQSRNAPAMRERQPTCRYKTAILRVAHTRIQPVLREAVAPPAPVAQACANRRLMPVEPVRAARGIA